MNPKIGKLTALGRKTYNVILMYSWQQINNIKKQNLSISAEHLFEAPIIDLVRKVSHSEHEPKTLIKKHLLEMRRIVMDLSAPDAKNGIVFSDLNLLSEVQIEIRNNISWVLWSFPPSLMKLISDINVFSSWLDIDEIIKLRSYTAIALYEICMRYKDNPSKLTCKNPTQWWVEVLSNSQCSKLNIKPDKNIREWRKIKHELVINAIDDINTNTHLTIKLIEIKIGRSVESVQFSIEKKPLGHTVIEHQIPANLALQASKLDINFPTISSLLMSGYSNNVIETCLNKLEGRINANGLEKIENKCAYLKKLIDKISPNIEKPSAIIDNKHTNKTVELVHSPESESRSLMKKEFLLLDDNMQLDYAHKCIKSLTKRKLISPTYIRLVAENKWKSGVLLWESVNIYATETYGENWVQSSY